MSERYTSEETRKASIAEVSAKALPTGAGPSSAPGGKSRKTSMNRASVGVVSHIEKERLQTFNFSVVQNTTGKLPTDLYALDNLELQNYTSAVLRYTPMEVAVRYYGTPIFSEHQTNVAYSQLFHESTNLGDQAYEHDFDGCVLFSDISGFTKLTNRLLSERCDEGAEILNNIINRFFEELISVITRHAGDVIKFAGDAVLSIWSSNTSGEGLETLTHRAIACALEQIERLHNWDTGEGGVKLQLHLGLGTGPVRGVDLGNRMRREYVVAGEPLKQLSDAEQQASSGQLVVSPQAWELVKGVCTGRECELDPEFGPGFQVITRCEKLKTMPPHWRKLLEDQLLLETSGSFEKPMAALSALYLYVPGPMRMHLVSADTVIEGKVVKATHAASQFREVTMMFIRIGGLQYTHTCQNECPLNLPYRSR